MRELNFSTPHLKATELILNDKFEITKQVIVINLSDKPVTVDSDKSTFTILESRLLSNTSISADGASVVIMETTGKDFIEMSEQAATNFKDSWDKASKLYPDVEELKKLTMHKSSKDTVGGYELNLWYLEGNSLGRIHQIHDFEEVHTQVLGTGMMQKYAEQTYPSVFETTYMIPGLTHYPYFDANGAYPWHSYNAITNCVWLAIEKHS